ncbi:MAG: DUF2877 domain-containing protein [Anaerolineales bacterium]|nr:DUF2877 domain-containing protein [Anaerolineales bacterium]
MYFNAISIGDAVPRTDFDATIHSVFQSAINLLLNRGNSLLTLVTSNEADLPQGIRVDTPADFSFEMCRTGEPVTCRDDILRCSFLTIDLRGAGRWKCDLPSLQADMTNPSVAIAWRHVWQALNERQIQSDAEIISENLFRLDETIRVGVSRKAGEAIRILFEATRRFDLTAASSLETLIGLGPGLTPAGDDLLMGYMAGLWCAAKGRSERLNFISALGEIVIRLSKGTNDISRTYLYHAACGQVSSRLFNLANAICAGLDLQHVRDCAKSAMQIGHTSGMDAVTGLLFGLAAWDIFPL